MSSTSNDGLFGNTQPFSMGWAVASVMIFTLIEISIALLISPMLLASRLASAMVQMRLDMLMHLLSFYVGGILVGVISPRVRMIEPAVGAFVAVAIVFMFSFFMPHRFFAFDLSRVFVGGGIAFGLALAGAYTGEKWMGNVGEGSMRGRVRDRMWGAQGLLSRGDPRFVVKASPHHTAERG